MRYRDLLIATFERVAAEPYTPASRERPEFGNGLRSLHTRYARRFVADRVVSPVHLVVYDPADPALIAILRVLHDRAEPPADVSA